MPDPPTARPDLVIQNTTIDDTTVSAGQEVRVGWEVKNAGAGSAVASVAGVYLSRDTTWDSSDLRVDDNSTTSLTAGATDTGEYDYFNIPTSVSAGTWYVLVVADYTKVVTESNEANNVAYKQITVAARSAKIQVDEIIIKPASDRPASVHDLDNFDLSYSSVEQSSASWSLLGNDLLT